jgi:predicted outer membrane repeat protein
MFACPEANSFRLLPRSACVDAGDDTAVVPGDTDLDSKTRIIDGDWDSTATVDMGAYEFRGHRVYADYITIQDAIDAAGDGDTVVVAPGVYAGAGNTELDLGGKLVMVCSEWGPKSCYIDGGNSVRAFHVHRGEPNGTLIRGFTIQNCSEQYGVAIRCENNSTLAVADCVIRYGVGSGTPSHGGAAWCMGGSSTVFTHCEIRGNYAYRGAGLFFGDGNHRVLNCLIADNMGIMHGAGVHAQGSSCTVTMTNCTIASNWTTDVTDGDGGGLYAYNSAYVPVSNSIIWGNSSGNNSGHQIYTSSLGAVELDTCCFGNAADDLAGTGISWVDSLPGTDPDFVDVSAENYHLKSGSACENAADPYFIYWYEDLDNRDRFVGNADLGPYEGVWYIAPDQYTTIQDAINAAGDGDVVGVRDGFWSGAGNVNLDPGGKDLWIRSFNGSGTCVIDGSSTNRAFYLQNGETKRCVIEGFAIQNCGGYSLGSAIYVRDDTALCSPVFRDCMVTSCTSMYGAVNIYDDRATFINCRIVGNTSTDICGGVYVFNETTKFVNCVISENTATTRAGGIGFYGNPKSTLINCTISNNSAPEGGGIYSGKLTIVNSIIWGNSGAEGADIRVGFDTMDISYSDINMAGVYDPTSRITWGNGNIDADPDFVGAGNYMLQPASPCIDVGSNALIGFGVAPDGWPRIIYGTVDMGAYEEHP